MAPSEIVLLLRGPHFLIRISLIHRKFRNQIHVNETQWSSMLEIPATGIHVKHTQEISSNEKKNLTSSQMRYWEPDPSIMAHKEKDLVNETDLH